jgi:putative transposase
VRGTRAPEHRVTLHLLLGRRHTGRREDTRNACPIIIGATPEGRKELVGLSDGIRKSAQSWRKLLLDLKRCGLSIGPSWRSPMARSGLTGGGRGLAPRRAALRCTKPPTSSTSCRTASNRKRPRTMRLPPSTPSSPICGVKHEKAVERLIKDDDALLGFYAPRYAPRSSTRSICAHDEHHRKLVHYGASPHRVLQGTSLKQDCARHDLQARRGCRKNWRRVNGRNKVPKIILGIRGGQIANSNTAA